MQKVKDSRPFKYNGYDAVVRTRSTPNEVYKTIELPLMAFAELGLKAHTVDGQLILEADDGCAHNHKTHLGEFMVSGYECDDCGERLYED